MTRIILQHGQNAPITLDVDGESMAPIHLHFSQAPDPTVPAEPVAGTQKGRIRRFLPLAGAAALCGGLFLTFGGLQASAPSMPESAVLPPLPMTGPMEAPAAPAGNDTTKEQLLKALHQPAHVEAAPGTPAPQQAPSPFGLEN
ncbi:hypothetical protein AD945_03075 [Gluconobacter albidus]|uniref:Uncharacterized protein n=1 Tax=Gluconobacter albidus TaxID=318683 RepID=A0A149TM07_9PROT|nr:hypothetical protein [Gluconobacter albidus]KXV49939.1 hypothetical protein AD945_03075 [Gluconobacter albidus]